MSDIAIDENGEFLFDASGDLALVTDKNESIRQHLQQRLKTFKGEWFLNRFLGLPYLQTILIKNPNSNLVMALMTDYVLATPGVIKIVKIKLSLDKATREMSVDLKAMIASGDTVTLGVQI